MVFLGIKWGHLLLSIPFILIGIIFNISLLMFVLITSYWFGREVSQAEYRWMDENNAKRSEKPWYIGFNILKWDRNSLFDDWLLPTIIALTPVLIQFFADV